MKKKLIYTIVLAIILVSIAFIAIAQPFILPKIPGKVWVEIDPIQCFQNPWERDWLESHNEDYSSYPGDPNTVKLEQGEIETIKDYYRKQGIKVFDVKSKLTYDVACKACTCPQGYTLYLLVSDSDVIKMLELGYRIQN